MTGRAANNAPTIPAVEVEVSAASTQAMIQFFCRCGHEFNVPDDEAGSLVQCPKCSLLRDVPNISDLKAIDEEGLYKLDAEPAPEEPRLGELNEVWGKDKLDYQGQEKDFRQGVDDLADVGADEVPLELFDEVRPGAPKYDPETGELIRPIDLKEDDEVKLQPIAEPQQNVPIARPALNYASKTTGFVDGPKEVTPFEALALLFSPQNVVVMFFVFLMHLLTQLISIPALFGFVLIVPAFLLMNCFILSHYACVIEDIGPDNRDELPRPLRHLDWGEDLWGPFVNFSFAVLYCYWPVGAAMLLNFPQGTQQLIILAMFAAGTFEFPAALLTSCTSGVWLNMRPDRVMDVIRIIGFKYVIAFLLWVVAGGLYLAGQIAVMSRVFNLMKPGGNAKWIWWASSYGLLIAAVIAMHYFCWYLGLMYRQHHRDFPWILQRHRSAVETIAWEQTRRAERQARLAMKRKY